MSEQIRPARPTEASALRELAHRSKAYWPYSEEFLAAVRPLLRLEAADIERDQVRVLEVDGTVAGWHRVSFRGEHAELEDLWLEPGFIGHGRGRLLFEDAAVVGQLAGAHELEWDAEPFALGFYLAMGGVVIGEVPSAAEAGRMLPRMRLDLRATPGAAPGRSVRTEDAGPRRS
ncbi:MAG: GNAT family N-acetyltransferase [Chloroflexota bacterium]|nr:GNAT family N-acetyltransferase [Chloroflexota bacterium]